VCEPDPVLEQVASAPIASGPSRRAGRAGGSGRHSAEPPGAAVNADEFERLRAWRWERAQGKPAYTVAPNAALEEVLRRRPANMRELIEVRGIGQSFCEKHGESMLAAVRELDERRPSATS
jgi:superfamily II DNA helicase RecQ